MLHEQRSMAARGTEVSRIGFLPAEALPAFQRAGKIKRLLQQKAAAVRKFFDFIGHGVFPLRLLCYNGSNYAMIEMSGQNRLQIHLL